MTELQPTYDLVFKKIFASPGNEAILIGLIEDLLDISIDHLEILTPYNIESIKRETQKMKEDRHLKNNMSYTEVDIKARTSNGQLITIEMQMHNMRSFIERSAYYTNQVYNNDFNQNEDSSYEDIEPTYGINIINYKLPHPELRALARFIYVDEFTLVPLKDVGNPNLTTLTYFSLINKKVKPNSKIHYWQKFFRGETLPDQTPQYINMAQKIVKQQNLTKEEFQVLSTQQRLELDRKAQLDYALDEGFDRGLANAVYRIYQTGHNIDEIGQILNMNIDEVDYYLNIAQHMNK